MLKIKPRQSIVIAHLLQCALEFQSDFDRAYVAQWRKQGGGKCGYAPRGAGLVDASPHFIHTFKKRVFQQKFRPKKSLKMCIF